MDEEKPNTNTKTNIEKSEEYKQSGNKEVAKENYDKAIEYYTLAIEQNSQNFACFGNRALCFQKQKKFQQAIEDCNSAIKLDSKFSKAYWRRAACRAQIGQLDYAINDYDTCLKLDPKNKNVHQELEDLRILASNYKQINTLYNEKKFKDCLNQINQALLECAEFPDLIYKKIECLARTNELDQAHKLIQQFQYQFQESPSFCYSQGIYMMYKSQNDKAKQYFMKGCKLDPDHEKCKIALRQLKQIESLKQQGNDAFKQNKLDQALQIYDQALLIDPENKQLNSLLHGNKSAAYLKMDKLTDALAESDKSIEFDDKNTKLYFRRADILEKLADQVEESYKKQEFLDKAIYDLNKIKELDQSQNIQQKLREVQKKAQQAKKKDYYKILGVGKDSTLDEIKKAYKKQAIRWHPDKNCETAEKKEEATAKFREIAEAYAVLSDKNKRAIFDQGGDPEGQNFGSGFSGGGLDPNQIFSMFFGGGGNQGGFSFGGGNDFFDQGGFGGSNFGGGFSQFPGGTRMKFNFH